SGFAGLCYTQLTDVEQEINGLMTYDRKLKFDAQKLREINALVHQWGRLPACGGLSGRLPAASSSSLMARRNMETGSQLAHRYQNKITSPPERIPDRARSPTPAGQISCLPTRQSDCNFPQPDFTGQS